MNLSGKNSQGEGQAFLLLGLIGHPVSHSLSPAMHLAAMKYIGRNGDYRLIDVVEEDLDEKLSSMHKDGYAGFNVTIPHKGAIYARCIGKSEDAVRTRAVNAVKIHADGKMIGHNTDLPAFKQALEKNFGNRNRLRALILGAGGASRSAIAALVDFGFSDVKLLVRNPEKHTLSDFFCGDKLIAGETFNMIRSEDFIQEEHDVPQLIVNCTPMGQASSELPAWVDAMFKRAGERAFFFDMVYSKNNQPTPMIAAAQKHGIAAVDGLEMLARQAALAFEYWTDKSVPPDVMLSAIAENSLAK
ncbi:MAG: shikimate dehydrogenase [Candidatus Melainabacteria bacterium]|jgi:shikimate dehydrogenase|nr:shikimate dehydrogenase [Candidatus Melainabacteria bacterium]